VFSNEDNILIKKLYQLKGYKALELTNKLINFQTKAEQKSSNNRLL